MKRLLLSLFISFFLINFAYFVSAIIINNNIEFKIENETYKTNSTMNFGSITIADSYIIFNNTGFYVTSINDITITLVYINNDITNANNAEKILDFYAATNDGKVWFNLSGFPTGTDYRITRDGALLSSDTANTSGFISFFNSQWSTHRFQIYQQGEGDITPPQISSITLTFSNPVDTQIGWENITSLVTDNNAVNEVILHLTDPFDSTTQLTMYNIAGTTIYYYNTTLSQPGNYTYFIWANDLSDNFVTSTQFLFSLPPNWDIDNDGECSVFDLVLVSNRYGETGDLGWIHEDIDNNGAIQVADFILLSNHYGESWYT
jgi:hypothetical protein